MSQSPLVYLTIINSKNEPLLFMPFIESAVRDELNFHLQFYSALDLFEDRINAKKTQYLGYISSVYSTDGQFDIYGYYSVTKVKMMAIVRQKANALEKYEDSAISTFFKNIYGLYKAEALNPFNPYMMEIQLSQTFKSKVEVLGKQLKLK